MILTKIRLTQWMFLCLLGFILGACAGPSVKQRVLMPANADVMKNTKKIAVIDFHGDRKGIFTGKVEQFFTGIYVQNAPYFSVIDPSMMDSIVAENFTVPDDVLDQASQLTEMADIGSIVSLFNQIASSAPGLGKIAPKPGKFPKPGRFPKVKTPDVELPDIVRPSYVFRQSDAVRLGQLSGADTIITGVVKWPYVQRKHYQKEESQCAQYEEKNNPLTPGLKSKKCVRYVKQKVDCTKQLAEIEYVIKAVRVDNNEIAFTKSYGGNAEHSYCKNDKYAKREKAMKLSQLAMDKAIRKMRQDVAPYEVTLTIQLLDKDESELKNNKDAKAFFDSGLAFAKKGRLDRACADFQNAEQIYAQSPAVYYNLGVCAEIKNDLDLALQNYKHSEDLLSKPNKYVTRAFTRVNDRIEKDRIVQDQLR